MYSIDTMTSLNLGEQGEHLANELRIDMSPWLEGTEGLKCYIYVLRHAETSAYIAATTMEDDNVLLWPVSSWDTAITGAGLASFVATDGTRIIRSKRIRTEVGTIIPGTEEDEIPEPMEAWRDELIAQITVIRNAAEAAQAGAETAQSNAETAQAAAEDARDKALGAQGAAETARDNARTAQNAAEAARDRAVSAETAANSARDSAQAAQAAAEAAQAAAAESAAAAKTSETNAKSSELIASVNQMSALNYSKSAKQSADKAESQASMAEVAKGLAFNKADEATASASAAAQSATNAAASASAASTSESNAAASAQAAAQSASQAAGSATQAGNSATAAAGSATQASQSATAAGQSARNAEDAAQDAQDVLDSIPADYSQMTADVADLQTSVANLDDRKANIDGYYQDMTVGDAEQLVSSQMVEDGVPYLFRKSGGSKDIGNRAYLDKIIGGTVAWNQLAELADTGYIKHYVTTAYTGHSVTLTSTNDILDAKGLKLATKQIATGHVCYMHCDFGENGIDGCSFGIYNKVNASIKTFDFSKRGRIGSIIIKCVDNSWIGFRIPNNTAAGESFTYSNLQVMDLTQMFGSTIADYIYSLEQATPGAGVAWFRNLFPAEYYPYNAGELISVSGLSEHIMRDADSNVIGHYPLDSSLTLRGIPKLDAENNLYYDGDEYTPDGMVKRKYGIVDLGTISWTKGNRNTADTGYIYRSGAQIPAMKSSAQVISTKFTNKGKISVWESLAVNEMTTSSAQFGVIICADYNTAEEFKSAVSGVMLVYELAAPTEETAEPYHETQIVDAFGTEEFVSDSIVPVGHITEYPANLRDKLEHLPDLASVDGVYMIHQQSGQMSLTPHPIPLAPSTDGTYTLKATVSNGTVTYTWEAVT